MTPYTATIKSEGKVMAAEVELLSIEVRRALDRIPEARLVVLDGSVATGDFPISNSAFFAIGKRIEILLRYGDDADARIFAGLV
ncbi:MAG: Rhs element Vgr protein, partial [Myxococcales bacterium]|nr:Rhs element Vgr protein [Myxococcales bacterium]